MDSWTLFRKKIQSDSNPNESLYANEKVQVSNNELNFLI